MFCFSFFSFSLLMCDHEIECCYTNDNLFIARSLLMPKTKVLSGLLDSATGFLDGAFSALQASSSISTGIFSVLYVRVESIDGSTSTIYCFDKQLPFYLPWVCVWCFVVHFF